MLATANSLQSESRNLGLHQIYPEPGNNDSGKDVDIIAIHGLDTQSPKQWVAWKKDGDPTSGEVHWLKDAHMLPHRIPNARISTYDWNANVDRGTAADSLFGFADQFLEELHIRILEGVKDRPIVFLASCFGGLLLIRALCRAFESQSEYQHILQSTAGVIFLGTPFQGSNETFSDAAQLRASVAVAAGRQGATELASYLQQDYKLDEMVQVFREMVKKEQFSFPIACYYETLESDFRSLRKQLPANLALEIRRDSGILVDKHSATLPGEKALPLNVRHSMISKYSTSDNQGFRTLSFRIEGMVKNARDTINRKRAVQQVSHESRGTIQVQANATETATATRTGGDPDPRDTTGLCLLSLDGGGVRGLSTIYILERIMHRLNDERRKSRLPRVKPCEVFDLIGGTGTGGLIAIMLGRLEMDVDQCIEAYNSIAASVFGGGPSPVPVDPTGKVPAPFDLAALKRAIRKMITASGASEKDVFNDGAERGCKTFVCTADRHTKDIVRLRSYTLSEERNIRATICEAALATSATTTFFEPVRIGARSFADGGLGANNPVDEVEGEASNIWCPGGDDLKPLVKCFISIGTGNPGKRPFEEGMADYLAQTVVQIATETEATETKFIARWMKHFDEKRYFRLNVDQGLQDIGLAEYERQGAIEAATDSYLGHADRKIRVRDCIRNLRSKQNKADTTLSAFIYEYDKRIAQLSGPLPTRFAIPFGQNHNLVGHVAEISPIHKLAKPGLTGNELIPIESSYGPFYYMQLPENARFTGRAAILRTLKEMIFGQQPCKRVALVGLGGVGKTQIALRFAYQVRESQVDCSIFWVPILSNNSLEQAYVEIAKRIGLQKSNEEEDIKDLVCRYLSSDWAGKWLMVVDNADDRDLLFGDNDNIGIEEFLPQSEQGSILLTTRSRQVAGDFAQMEVVDVEQMSHGEAFPFLTRSLQRKAIPQDDKSATELLTHLTYLPLAIAQAAAYLNQTKMPIHKYLGLLRGAEKDVARVLGRDFKDPTRYKSSQNAIATTWLVSFEQIQKSDRAAISVLSFLSCIEPKAIPQSILPECESEEELEWAIGLLCGYSFLVRRGESDIFDMHHLVQTATRGWIEKSGRQEKVLSDGINHLAEIFPLSDRVHRDIWRGYLPHALRVLERSREIQTEQRAKLCMDVGQCLDEARRFKEAIGCYQAAHQYRGKLLPADNHFRLASEHRLARAYLSDRRIKEATEMFEHVVSIRKTTMAENDHDQLTSEHDLASAYLDDRRIQEAIEIFEHVVSVRKMTLAEDDHFRLTSEHELARAYLENRQIKEAINMFEHVVSVRRTKLPEADHNRLDSEHELASAYLSDRRIKEAIEMFEHIVSVGKMTLAESDHDQLASEHGLASAYLDDLRIKEAIKIFEHVVSMRKMMLAEGDHFRLTSEHELARAYLQNWQTREAIQMFEHVVSVRKTTLSEKDHSRLNSEHELASAYLFDGRVRKAIEIFEHVLSVRKTTLAEADQSRLNSEQVLASAYLDDGRIKEAIEIFEHVVSVRKMTLAEDDHFRLTSEHELARAYLENRQIKEAIKIFEHVVCVQSTTLGEKDRYRLASEHELARAYLANNEAQKSIDLLENVVAIQKSLFGKDDPARLVSVELLRDARIQLEAEWESIDIDV